MSYAQEPSINSPGFGLLAICISLFIIALDINAFSPAIVDSSRAGLACAIIFMLEITGGAVGLGINTAVVGFAPDITAGISRALEMNACLAMAGFIIAFLFMSVPKVAGSGRG